MTIDASKKQFKIWWMLSAMGDIGQNITGPPVIVKPLDSMAVVRAKALLLAGIFNMSTAVFYTLRHCAINPELAFYVKIEPTDFRLATPTLASTIRSFIEIRIEHHSYVELRRRIFTRFLAQSNLSIPIDIVDLIYEFAI